jgi:polyisoprenoid-binding protein YceI
MYYKIDTAHTTIQFSVRHMMLSRVRGQFEHFTGSVLLDEKHPENTSLEIQVETTSINTREPKRDNHLRSADFFNSTEYPHMVFKSRRVEVLDQTHARLHGYLTIRNITREISLDVEYLGYAKSPWGTTSHGFTASAKINRRDWNLTWNQALETGGVLVGDEVELMIELELIRQPENQPAAA